MKKHDAKLLYLVNNDWFFLSHRLSLARAAKEAGYEVIVATRVNEDGDARRIINEGFRLYPLRFFQTDNLNPFKEILTLLEIALLFLRERPAIVHHIGLKLALTGSVAAKLTGVPAVVITFTGLGYLFTRNDIKASIYQRIVLTALKFALAGKNTRLIFQNSEDREQFLSRRVIDESRTTLIRGSGVDTNEFPASPPPEGIPVILFASRILWDKGIGDLVEAVKILRQRGTVFRAVIAGKPDHGNPKAVPEKTLRQWHNEGLIEWWGHRDDMPEVFKQSHIVCLPSFREGLPKFLLEAASCARPIVATDIPGCRDIARHGSNALLVPPKNPELLADALHNLIENPVLREEMGQAGREIVEEKFTIEYVIKETLAVYSLISGERA